ncbi:MAG: hydantoinase B/oxoprolinase family protein [Bacteroidota bacterium]
MNRWQIWIDTGGTFTDGLGLNHHNDLQRVKVLSSGGLRAHLIQNLGNNEYLVEYRFLNKRADLLSNYQLQLLDHPERSYQVVSLDPDSSILKLKEPLPPPLPATVEFTAREEAPVLATRLLTQTPLHEPFPPLQLRLGTTKGTNALLERKGAKVALLITKGFADLPYIGTQQRPHLFQLDIPEPALLHQQVIEVEERLAADGTVLQPLTTTEIDHIVSKVDADSVAVALLHTYRNPEHEEQLQQALKKAGYQYTSISHALSPSVKLLTRSQTALVNAYLDPIIDQYLTRIRKRVFPKQMGHERFLVMSSAGSLQAAPKFRAKDSLLSGPAGGVVGAARIAKSLGIQKILTLDMGGTSTDTARYAGQLDYRFKVQVGDATVLSPGLAIETVAAGGGSICDVKDGKLIVGPKSAGAFPGPACYGAGGPLTITDVNLLLEKLIPDSLSVPLSRPMAEKALTTVQNKLKRQTGLTYSREQLLRGFEQIANEKMAAAIRRISVQKGFDPREYALLAFGGAGGMHACAIAKLLGINTIILPRDAGLLSAYGIGHARIERLNEIQVLEPLSELSTPLVDLLQRAFAKAKVLLHKEGFKEVLPQPARILLYLRFQGQDTPLEIRYREGMDVAKSFAQHYKEQFGYLPQHRTIELESIKVFAATRAPKLTKLEAPQKTATATTADNYQWEQLEEAFCAKGPFVLSGQQATAYVAQDWEMTIWPQGHALLKRQAAANDKKEAWGEAVELELFTNRFAAIANAMGSQLQRTAFSVNVKERLDFSCALLDAQGQLVVNAPHIPVHLGSLGICARLSLAHTPVSPGDVLIVNHPKYGGSHLPDITLLQGVFTAAGDCIGYVINRAHHAEVGGKRPGSMPPDAQNLAEEGVVFTPQYLVKAGQAQWEAIEEKFTAGPFPTRALAENLADLRAGLAALKTGERALLELAHQHGSTKVLHYMEALQQNAAQALAQKLIPFQNRTLTAAESLDDGHSINLKLHFDGTQLAVDFSGTSEIHPTNFNANISIVYSALMYVLRLVVEDDIPLNEGLLRFVQIELPPNTFLHPHFVDSPEQCPAVVGGNTEVSQRLVDTLLKAFGLAAASQGTMNNFLFGNAAFGYYETIGGGVGAGPGFHGRSGVHQHMTNTRITDPEDLERVYPVRLREFSLRQGSGGVGKWQGGDGLVREVEALVPLEVTLLTQRRASGPYGQVGGNAGQAGVQYQITADGQRIKLEGVTSVSLQPKERIRIETPGGGGWG